MRQVNTLQKIYNILQQKLEDLLKYFTVALNNKMHKDEFSNNLGKYLIRPNRQQGGKSRVCVCVALKKLPLGIQKVSKAER